MWQEDVETALKAVSGISPSFGYPASFAGEKVAVSYRQADQRVVLSADNAPYTTVTEIYVDAWNADPSRVAMAAAGVKTALVGIGFDRVFSQDLYEVNSGLHHRSERYIREEDEE